jgi:predicted nucleotidyltransferase
MQPLKYNLRMDLVAELSDIIGKIGIKEIARRTGLAPSTISRVNSGKIIPSIAVVEKILNVSGFDLKIIPTSGGMPIASKLEFSMDLLMRLRKQLNRLGVQHAYIFGSVARGEDRSDSDVDVYLQFKQKPLAAQLLKSEGLVIQSFGKVKADVIGWIDEKKDNKLLLEIKKDGVRVF